MQQAESLAAKHGTEPGYSRDVTARAVETGDKAGPDRVATTREHDWNDCGRRLGSQNGIATAGRGDHHHFAVHKYGRKRRQAIVLVFCITIFYRDVPAFDVTGFTQATPERLRKIGPIVSPETGQETDYRHRRLL